MSEFAFTEPVALICFNRPRETALVMDAIRQARPRRLHIIADAPRPNVAGEAERCAEVRTIATAVDWPCEVITDFAEKNLGCRDRVISGLTRAFAQSEQLIILEDDCIPHPDFFRFCHETLAKYRDDGRVFAISGDNFQETTSASSESYYFSRIFHCWGWASWRDRWDQIDFSMSRWPELRESDWLVKTLRTPVGADHYRLAFDQTHGGKNSSWAYRASFASLAGGHVNILPRVNMVTNIGVGIHATHTLSDTGFERRAAHGMQFPLKDPAAMVVDEEADRYTFNRMGGSWKHRLKVTLLYMARHILPNRSIT